MMNTAYQVCAAYSSFDDAIAAGDYHDVDSRITAERLGIQSEIHVDTDDLELTVVNWEEVPAREIYSQLREIKAIPASHEEALAFATKFPYLLRERPIVGLGQEKTHIGGLVFYEKQNERRVGFIEPPYCYNPLFYFLVHRS